MDSYIYRAITPLVNDALNRQKSILLMGARQTGKTTLLNHITHDMGLSFIQPQIRQRYEQNPSALTGEIEAFSEQCKNTPLILIDEIQKVPVIMDVVQDLIDRHIAQFILTGSSARKLKKAGQVNLLPGRVVATRLDPLTITELNPEQYSLLDRLYYGTLPGIVETQNPEDKEIDLRSYVTTYLEEEIRAESLVRNLGPFSRFLSLAAAESGKIVNFSKLSQEIGVAHTTITSYYQILEDCLVAERIEPLIHTNTRRKLSKIQKYLIFDLGVRRLCAGEGIHLPESYLGYLFEQFVGLELLHLSRLTKHPSKIHYWRDTNGPEVDWVIVKDHTYFPIEVKWTTSPTLADARYLQVFMKEYEARTKLAYIICQTPKKIKLSSQIYAIPWQDLPEIILDSAVETVAR